uniref:Uncharacterized protein TCIL3000_10_5640 n=1 Tax=Trypanosoma congolense (strain IL3000) TaxID=1068625 RepID=G0UWN2_TRYCI|nr:unnamed protein product [Trypanosoma congolense IL3000]
MPSISRRLDSASISTTSRGYNLELQSFCELGGGPDGSGTIRLIDLKRMLQSFNIEATFGPCLGKKIDKNNTGCITFNEFLWILEFGVRGKGPAAGIHDNLAAPLPSQSGAIPPFIAERSPRSERRGRVAKSPPLKKSRLALALETIRSFSGCGKLSPYLTKLKPDRHPRGRRRSSPIGRRANKTRSLSPYRRMPSGRPPSCRRAPSRKKFPGRPPTSRGIGERKYL